MNKTAIKNFAIWARNKLIADITYKAGLLGISEKGIKSSLPQSTNGVQFFDIGTKEPYSISGIEIRQREALATVIRSKEQQADYVTAYKSVIEEVAYTWFNRLIAVRFMEINDYLPSHVRVLSSESAGKDEPDLVTNPFDTDLEFTPYEKDRIMQLKQENKLDELFRMLFIKQCNTLNAILPHLFEKTSDYTELLLNVAFTDKDGLVNRLVHDISEDDFNVSKEGQVEIIGWLYQYYNTEPKDETFALLKKNVKITKERIPAATQLFTPDWIVRYMVENSLGRLWLESHPTSLLREGWKYYLEESEQTPAVADRLSVLRAENAVKSPEAIKVIDPCMGSGHILVYAFDVLMQIYTSEGYSERDAAKLILEKNIFGLELDRRAYQLAYFALMMKARQYNRRILTLGVLPQMYEPTSYADGMEYGSLVRVDKLEPMPEPPKDQLTLFAESYETKMNTWHFRRLLAQKYEVVVTNPPYMNSSGMNSKLSTFVKKHYQDSKSDISFCFMEKCLSLCSDFGIYAMINIPVWMNISSCENLRNKIIQGSSLISMLHFGRGVFGSDFGSCAFVFRKLHLVDYSSVIRRLYVKQGSVDTVEQKEGMFFEKQWVYKVKMTDFLALPGNIIAYTLSEKGYELLANSEKTSKFATARQGMATADNNRFLRFWFEISSANFSRNITKGKGTISDDEKWVPYSKGGAYHKWFGNNDYVVNWQYNGIEIRTFKKSVVRNPDFYFTEGLTWTALTAGNFSMRYQPPGFAFDSMGPVCFPYEKKNIKYILGVFNSKVGNMYLNILCPNFKFDQKPLENVPLVIDFSKVKLVDSIVDNNIDLSKKDWNSFETSWDFIKHPLIQSCSSIKDMHEVWKGECINRFNTLKANEEELNRIFIDIYGLQDELTPEVENKDVTIRKADLERDIRSFISYSVGCMFGRYSLDVEGLAYAGGQWDDNKYSTFIPDKDNILPITDEEYFEDDILGLFVAFVKKIYSAETLEQNLDFIAKALGNKGNTSREIIRNYFVKDFFKDHCKVYQKRPIYWLFDSGKNDGFKALIYMHRYDENTVGNIRVDYLHKMQRVYEREIVLIQETINNSANAREVAAAEKRKDKLTKQLKETKDYDEKIAHLALARIAIDLDDGVKANYEKVQTGTDGKKLEVLAKI